MWIVEFKPMLLTQQADIFSIRVNHDIQSEFEKFYILFKDTHDRYLADDLNRILASIKEMGTKGILENGFRPEGKLADRVSALPLLTISRNIQEHGTLRLYCLRLSDKLLVLGGGGVKYAHSYEEDPNLSAQVDLLQAIDKELTQLETNGVDLQSELYNITLRIQ